MKKESSYVAECEYLSKLAVGSSLPRMTSRKRKVLIDYKLGKIAEAVVKNSISNGAFASFKRRVDN